MGMLCEHVAWQCVLFIGKRVASGVPVAWHTVPAPSSVDPTWTHERTYFLPVVFNKDYNGREKFRTVVGIS